IVMSRHRYTETAFEAAIEEHLLNYGGYQKRTTETFDPELCLDTEIFLRFVQTNSLKNGST
ncbi:MAG: hypothetical protein WBH30_04585, partial [Bacillota bacterium]